MNFYKKQEGPVAAYPTKYDNCVLRATGRPYRFQEGSGRAAILNRWGSDGARLGDITAAAAREGYDPNFTIGAIFRQHETKDGAWTIEAPEGQTLDELKGLRAGRQPSPEQVAKREHLAALKAQRAEEREQAKAAKEAARIAREAEKEAERERRAAARAEAAQLKAKAAEELGSPRGGGSPEEAAAADAPGKLKGKRGKRIANPAPTAAEIEAGAAAAAAADPIPA